MSASKSLLSVFSSLEDPRKARGVRHPFASIVSLTVLGMLGRIREMEVLVRHYWANANNLPVFYSFGVNQNHIRNRIYPKPMCHQIRHMSMVILNVEIACGITRFRDVKNSHPSNLFYLFSCFFL